MGRGVASPGTHATFRRAADKAALTFGVGSRCVRRGARFHEHTRGVRVLSNLTQEPQRVPLPRALLRSVFWQVCVWLFLPLQPFPPVEN